MSEGSAENMERGEENIESFGGDQCWDFEVKEQDVWLPIASVAKTMRTALPDDAKISREAQECMQECVSESISFITSEAAEICDLEKRRVISGEEILRAYV